MAERPSAMSALVAAALVAAHDPGWLSAPVAQRARESGVRPERVSRAKTRVGAAFDALVARATRRGRPAAPEHHEEAERAAPTQALLAVASGVLARLGIGSRAVQDELVAAQERLQREHATTKGAFCAALGLSDRTFRSWRCRAPAAPPGPPESPTPRRRPRTPRGRFALEVTPAGVSAMADTSDWECFGVPLKILAVQDPGARGLRIWEAAHVETSEDAEKVVAVVSDALGERPGTQLVTDQGTPYLAAAARAAYDEMELEHAPQVEARPTDKAPLERSFRTAKDALAPLVRLTAAVAEAVPALGQPDFAATAGRLLLGTFLAVDLAARRSTLGAAGAPDPEVFEALAQDVRESARAEARSVKLALARIHLEYDMPGSSAAFVRRFRSHTVADVLEAERQMGTGACRCHAKACDRYFAAILRRVTDESATRRAAGRRRALERAAKRRQVAADRALREHRRAHPEEWIAVAVQGIAAQWDDERGGFALGPHGPFCGDLRGALRHLASIDPGGARDRAEVGWTRWAAAHSDLATHARDAVRAAFERSVAQTISATAPSLPELASDMLRTRTQRHPPPTPRLRI